MRVQPIPMVGNFDEGGDECEHHTFEVEDVTSLSDDVQSFR